MTTPADAAGASSLQHALDGFATSLEHLVKVVEDGALEDLDAPVWSGSSKPSSGSATGSRSSITARSPMRCSGNCLPGCVSAR